jgi:hypothetical protein
MDKINNRMSEIILTRVRIAGLDIIKIVPNINRTK